MDFQKEANRIYVENDAGAVIAEISFEEMEPGVCVIDHTFVDASLRGQGIAKQLVEMAVEFIEGQGKQVDASCSYAKAYLEKR